MKQGDKAMPAFDYQAALLRDVAIAKQIADQQIKGKAMKKAKGKGKGGGKC